MILKYCNVFERLCLIHYNATCEQQRFIDAFSFLIIANLFKKHVVTAADIRPRCSPVINEIISSLKRGSRRCANGFSQIGVLFEEIKKIIIIVSLKTDEMHKKSVTF